MFLPLPVGLAAGLAAGLPLDTLALGLLLAWLAADLLFVHLPERFGRSRGGRGAAAADERRRAATWNALPAPRRTSPRPPITVAAVVEGMPQVRALPAGPVGLGPRHTGGAARRDGLLRRAVPRRATRLRVVRRRRGTDGEVVAACWDAASRRSARLVDAVAVELGLARDELPAVPSADPDPLLLAARWPVPVAPRRGNPRRGSHGR